MTNKPQYQAVCSNCNCNLILEPEELKKGEFICEECKHVNKFNKSDLTEIFEDEAEEKSDAQKGNKKISRNQYIIGIIVLAVVAIAYFGWNSDINPLVNKKSKAEKYVKSGTDLFSAQVNSQTPDMSKIQEALVEFKKALEYDPENLEALNSKALILANTGKFAEAIVDLTKVISINPNLPDSYFYRGLCRLQTGDLANSLTDFNKTLELNPENMNAFFYRANTRYLMKDFQGTKEDMNKIIATEPTIPNSYALRGLCDIELGNKKSSCEDFKKAKELGFPQADSLLLQYCK